MKSGELIIPIIIIVILLLGAIKKVKLYEAFVQGAKEGFRSVYSIAAYLLTMLFAIDLFRKSGALDYMIYILRPLAELLRVPEGVLPMFLIKPLSGSGALGILTDTISTYGVDSMEGRIAAVMMGSTETIFYTISVYLGACSVKKPGASLPAALVAHVAGSLAAVYICYIIW
jgi:spore maturation protein B